MSLRRQDSHTPQPQFEDGSVYGEKRPTEVDSNYQLLGISLLTPVFPTGSSGRSTAYEYRSILCGPSELPSSGIVAEFQTPCPGACPRRSPSSRWAHAVHYLHGRQADGADPTQQVDHSFLVVGKAVVVELLPDGRVPGFPLLVLVQHPLQGGAVAQPVLPGLGGNARQRGALVQGYRPTGLVRPQDGPLRINPLPVVPLQRIRLGGLEPDVQVQQLLAHFGPVVEVPVQGQAGELPQQVHPVVVAIDRVVQDGVGLGEDILGGDALGPGQFLKGVAPFLAVVVVELPDTPVGDVADPLPVGGVAV